MKSESLFENCNLPLLSTRQKRYNQVSFSAELENKNYILKSSQGKLAIDIIDEIILRIILSFRFCPSWLVKQWYNNSYKDTIDADSSSNKIRQFIDFGLLFEFPSAVAVFLMPTDRLATLFGEKLGPFTNPPYNTLTHTISEQKVMFDCMSGNSSYIKDEDTIPFVSALGLGVLQEGSTVIPEQDYSISSRYFNNHLKELNNQEALLAKEILKGKIVTTEDFKNQNLVIHKKFSQDKYDFKIPDLAVLAPRKLSQDGIAMPQSYAIEVELTCKGTQAYENIFEIYWSNLKYGNVIYLINSSTTRKCLTDAIDNIYFKHGDNDSNKTCNFAIYEFVIPYNEEQLLASY